MCGKGPNHRPPALAWRGHRRIKHSDVIFWVQGSLAVLQGLKKWFQTVEIQGLGVLLIIYLFSSFLFATHPSPAP